MFGVLLFTGFSENSKDKQVTCILVPWLTMNPPSEKKNTQLACLPKTYLVINVARRGYTFASGVFHHVHLSTGVHMLGKRTLDKRCK